MEVVFLRNCFLNNLPLLIIVHKIWCNLRPFFYILPLSHIATSIDIDLIQI